MRSWKPDLRIRPRGRCPECGYPYRLTKTGLLNQHKLYTLSGRVQCEGGGKLPVVNREEE